ncbi:hypothetical protein AK812_SmicGene29861 [Symbiodinium microadriaticum]|uniref:Uncharacterized protein n=1 Tax=Symbiodinium microadriaticum TaxID=2951 RepID=A0A1Q9D0Q3_SYMMI|nr:hypothetical protein AK812_SmicGene29861 [Symbiodinium microadriaticum]
MEEGPRNDSSTGAAQFDLTNQHRLEGTMPSREEEEEEKRGGKKERREREQREKERRNLDENILQKGATGEWDRAHPTTVDQSEQLQKLDAPHGGQSQGYTLGSTENEKEDSPEHVAAAQTPDEKQEACDEVRGAHVVVVVVVVQEGRPAETSWQQGEAKRCAGNIDDDVECRGFKRENRVTTGYHEHQKETIKDELASTVSAVENFPPTGKIPMRRSVTAAEEADLANTGFKEATIASAVGLSRSPERTSSSSSAGFHGLFKPPAELL